MKAIDSRILVKVKKGECVEKIGGLTVPVGAGEFEVADVISVGSEVKDIKEGDTVYIYVGSGKNFHKDGEEYRVVPMNEVIVVL